MSDPKAGRVVVVTGAATGIGAAIAEKLGSEGAFVVTLDANVSLDGSAPSPSTGPATAERIVDSGGSARAANMSVTDAAAVGGLFDELVAEFGSVDAVVNVAGISRPTSFATGNQPDWEAVLAVHLEGYLTVLRAALPIMAAAGYGRIVGVTSGSGWRPANAGAYGCAKRAVAALTWQLGKVAPAGVTINALSPIAATRMVTESLRRASPDRASRQNTTGGVTLTGFPTPDKLGPVGAYLAGDELAWCNGRVLFSAGAELALIAEPRLIEVVRNASAGAAAAVLSEVVPGALVSAEAAQATAGGSTARFVEAFAGTASGVVPASGASVCIVADDDQQARRLVSALEDRGMGCTSISAPERGISAASEQLQQAAEQAGQFDAVVIALAASRPATDEAASAPAWQQVLDDHGDLPAAILEDAAWMRAAADHSASNGRALRVVALVDATTPAGRSRAQAATQLSRAARGATDDRVSAVVISSETDGDQELVAALIGHLVAGPDTEELSGAELCAGDGWIGLRDHPAPAGTVNFGGPEVPDWMAAALRAVVEGSPVGVI